MSFQFTKMQGLGNDFVVIDNVQQSISMSPELARKLSDRRYGVGCDQILMVEPSHTLEADFQYRIYNADGSEVYQCGNGARCLALFIKQRNLSDKRHIRLATQTTVMDVSVLDDNSVTVTMGNPSFHPIDIPFVTKEMIAPHHLIINGEKIEFDVVNVGNPHCVIMVEDLGANDLDMIATTLNQHPAFPEGVNVGFMAVESPDKIQLEVIERGAGRTAACGSGACAAMVSGRKRGFLNADVSVSQPGGDLQVAWPSESAAIRMTGPAQEVFEAVWLLS